MQTMFLLCVLVIMLPPVVAVFVLIRRLGICHSHKNEKNAQFELECMKLAADRKLADEKKTEIKQTENNNKAKD